MREGVAGERSYFAIQLRDQWSNASRRGCGRLAAHITPPEQPSRAYLQDEAAQSAHPLALRRGSEAGQDVARCVLMLPRQPDPSDPNGMVASFDGGEGDLEEADGNLVAADGDLWGGDGGPLAALAGDTDGAIAGYWESKAVGLHYLHLSLANAPLPGSPFEVCVRAGPTVAAAAVLHGGGGLIGARPGATSARCSTHQPRQAKCAWLPHPPAPPGLRTRAMPRTPRGPNHQTPAAPSMYGNPPLYGNPLLIGRPAAAATASREGPLRQSTRGGRG